MFISTVADVRPKDSGVDGVPPAMRTFDNDVQIRWINMHVVFFTIIANDSSKQVLLLRCDGVLGC